MKLPFSFRPVNDGDTEFLFRLYATTRPEIQQLIDWSAEQKDQFLRMQFQAQQTHYKSHFPATECSIIVNRKRKPIGRFYLEQRQDEFRIIDISLLPDHRRKGVGSTIIRDVMDRGRLACLPVRLHVARQNPALSWYTRMGFETIGETDMSFLMEWSSSQSAEIAVSGLSNQIDGSTR